MKSFIRTFLLLLPGGYLLLYFAPDMEFWQYIVVATTLFVCGMIERHFASAQQRQTP